MDKVLINALRELAEKQTVAEYIESEYPEAEYITDYFDGDADDAYHSGVDDGKIELARELLKSIEENV